MGNQLTNEAYVFAFKTFLLGFNFLFLATGILLLVAGIWATFDLYTYVELEYPEISGTAPQLLIGIAGLIIVVTSVAFSCIIKGQPALLFIYGAILACIFMMDVGVGAAVCVYQHTFAKGLYDGLTRTLASNIPKKDNLNFAQATLHCCGVSNYTDWTRLSPQRVIPTSCCLDPNNCITANYMDVYQRGCYEVIVEYLTNNMNFLYGIMIVTGSLPILGTFLSCCLAKYIKKSNYDAMN
ncbi:tetraspanin-7-like [Ostrinia nubilalis]|uniref:tetraspanin-7-like n=1 Tax=Ostrinia nubilalis TaxID=29057 RepID=UPI00308220A5